MSPELDYSTRVLKSRYACTVVCIVRPFINESHSGIVPSYFAVSISTAQIAQALMPDSPRGHGVVNIQVPFYYCRHFSSTLESA